MRQQISDERKSPIVLLAECLDEEILLSLLVKDVKANFDLLFSKYKLPIYKRALRMMGNHEDSEEIVQETFLHAYQALIEYPEERIRSLLMKRWLYTIARNQIFNSKRKWKKDRVVDSIERLEWEYGESDASKQPELAAITAEGERYILECIDKLPEEYQALVKVYLVYNVTNRQLAKMSGKSANLTKSLLTAGIALLREMLEEKNSQIEEKHCTPQKLVS